MTDIEDILIALKNALERGQSRTSAKQSLINAGYSDVAINAASDSLNAQATQQQIQVNIPERKVDNTIKKLPQYQQESDIPVPSEKKGMKASFFIILIIILLILGGAAAFILKKFMTK